MKLIDLQAAADFLESATIETTHEVGHTTVHSGTNAAGARFVLINDCFGNTSVTEAL